MFERSKVAQAFWWRRGMLTICIYDAVKHKLVIYGRDRKIYEDIQIRLAILSLQISRDSKKLPLLTCYLVIQRKHEVKQDVVL